MVAEDSNDDRVSLWREVANTRLATILGVVAFGIYIGFIWFSIQ